MSLNNDALYTPAFIVGLLSSGAMLAYCVKRTLDTSAWRGAAGEGRGEEEGRGGEGTVGQAQGWWGRGSGTERRVRRGSVCNGFVLTFLVRPPPAHLSASPHPPLPILFSFNLETPFTSPFTTATTTTARNRARRQRLARPQGLARHHGPHLLLRAQRLHPGAAGEAPAGVGGGRRGRSPAMASGNYFLVLGKGVRELGVGRDDCRAGWHEGATV